MAARGPQNGRRGLERGVPLGRSEQLSLNKFFDPNTLYVRKGNSGENGEKKRLKRIVATTSLPAVDRLNDDHWNAARSCQYYN